MPGVGTKTAITTSKPVARCLDLTRLISRVGRGPWTGVDRVELAYLRHLLIDSTPLYLLVKTVFGFVVLDKIGSQEIHDRLTGKSAWGRTDFIGTLSRKANLAKRRAEADLRRLCIARCLPKNLPKMLQRTFPNGCTYLNVGHSNLTENTLTAWKTVPSAQISILIHDTIPLDYPEHQRPGTPEVFERKLKMVTKHADRIICNSAQTERDVTRWAQGWGNSISTCVAHLGLDIARPESGLEVTVTNHPYFVCLATIEPRKNHALLLDVWEQFQLDLPADEIPYLHIVGSRGWANEDVFSRLDTVEMMNKTVFEHANMPDDALTQLIFNATGMLFPSVAEGYGLPPAEAIMLGVPVICTKLAVYEEFLGNIPVYLDSADVYEWKQSILQLVTEKQVGQTKNVGETPAPEIPTWESHFNLVLKMT